jgi:hypothetical protein
LSKSQEDSQDCRSGCQGKAHLGNTVE